MSTYSNSFPLAFSFLYATLVWLSVLQVTTSSIPNAMKFLTIAAICMFVFFCKIGFQKLAKRA